MQPRDLASCSNAPPTAPDAPNPHAYLADIINRIADHPANRIDELLLGTGPPNHSVHLNPRWTLSGSRPNASARSLRHAYSPPDDCTPATMHRYANSNRTLIITSRPAFRGSRKRWTYSEPHGGTGSTFSQRANVTLLATRNRA
ncbi:transposase domain-containing protein [Sinorhizobium meliloti]|uniref:transposase domain-containing protein n=1 Tax=Rhizobium meliloti TaxID=382 RepID=UPI003988C97C